MGKGVCPLFFVSGKAGAVGLVESSLESLDWRFVLDALAGLTRTAAGKRAVLAVEPADTVDAVTTLLEEVEEIARLEESGAPALPLGDIEDVAEHIHRAVRGEVLEKAELLPVAATVDALGELMEILAQARATAPTLHRRVDGIVIDRALRRDLMESFTQEGELSEQRYPQLGELRRRIATLERQARAMLEAIVTGGQFDAILQDRYLTVRADRYVLPVKAQAKSFDFGIVHDASRSGQTIYVEPHRVVPLNNERRLAETQLRAEEHRILRELSAEVGRHARDLSRGLEAATVLDFASARRRLAGRLDAVRPSVGESGTVDLRLARHPVLVLEGIDVVSNDLRLDAERPVLVLTGPNAGGKTIALKTIGLAAMLVRIGCFVPAAAGSRVDVFPQLFADIGDRQTVHEGLSSFSAHLATLREMLDGSREGTLLLLDELAAGTDPAQGGALARALIERFADVGARVVVTTHYAQLKAAAAADPRVTIAAMEYRDERPTYRIVPGIAGESHGFAAALRAGIDARLVIRARALMDQGERALHDAIAALEAERARAEERALRAEEQARALREQEAAVAAREEKVRRRLRELEQGASSELIERIRAAEHEVARVVADLQRDPSSRSASTAREALKEMRSIAVVAEPEAPPSPLAIEPAVGAEVRVHGIGLTGEITAIRERDIEIHARGMTLRVRRDEIDVVRPAPKPGAPGAAQKGARSRTRRAAISPEGAVRVPSNTLDIRGARVAEGLEALDRFLDEAVLRGADAVFVLHGHGTGALKAAIRKALADSDYVEACAPALPEQGGDAFTVAVLR
jgi:DNA mismatch repair protein MutS2